MKNGLKMTMDKLPEFQAAVKLLTQEAVYVGIPEPANGRQDPAGNALIGAVQEAGSPVKNIPARPHLVPGIQAVQAQVAEELGAGASALLRGRPDAVQTSYTRAGLIAVQSVKKVITAGEGFAPLSAGTLKARAARGVTRTKPLIDTGQYRNAITYVIRKRK
jgi:hypothetical protein